MTIEKSLYRIIQDFINKQDKAFYSQVIVEIQDQSTNQAAVDNAL